MVPSASTPAPDPSPVDLCTLLVHNSTGLAVRRGIVVLCTIETAAIAPVPAPFPSAVYRAARKSEPTAATAAPRPKVDSH